MNNNPRHARPAVHRAHRNPGHHFGNRNGHQPRSPVNFVRPKPPSQSRAPWDITQWVDPIQLQNSTIQK